MHSLPNWRVLVPFLVALVAGLVVAWSSSAASDPATTASATRGSIAVVGNGLYRRYPSDRSRAADGGRARASLVARRQADRLRPLDRHARPGRRLSAVRDEQRRQRRAPGWSGED